jgi:predicted outer membrane lipoprotein
MLLATSLIAAFGIFEALALRHGAESRPGFDERPERGPHNSI